MKITLFENDIPNDFHIKGDLAIDTETMGLNLHRDRLCVLQFSCGDGDAYLVQFKSGNYQAPNLKALLEDETRCKIFHFARFDLAAIKEYLDVELNNVFCTKIASRLVRTYTDSHSLKTLCRELLTIDLSKQQQSSNWGADTLTREQQAYAAKDVLYLHELRAILLDRLIGENRSELAHKIFQFLPARVELDLTGWHNIDIFAHSFQSVN